MSIEINPGNITAVYALGEWHEVYQGSFYIDAYEIVDEGYTDKQPGAQLWNMQLFYPEELKGYTGAAWAGPNGHMATALCEVKAFRFDL